MIAMNDYYVTLIDGSSGVPNLTVLSTIVRSTYLNIPINDFHSLSQYKIIKKPHAT